MKTSISIVAAVFAVAMIAGVSSSGFAASEEQCPAGFRKMTVADHGIVLYTGDPCISVKKLKGSPSRRITVEDAGSIAFYSERFTAGTEVPVHEKVETIEIGVMVYRVGIDGP